VMGGDVTVTVSSLDFRNKRPDRCDGAATVQARERFVHTFGRGLYEDAVSRSRGNSCRTGPSDPDLAGEEAFFAVEVGPGRTVTVEANVDLLDEYLREPRTKPVNLAVELMRAVTPCADLTDVSERRCLPAIPLHGRLPTIEFADHRVTHRRVEGASVAAKTGWTNDTSEPVTVIAVVDSDVEAVDLSEPQHPNIAKVVVVVDID